ncbi:type III-B CRISPR module RAMP protein Cmr6 [Oryzibacter oryziterrae]|uniref:type III-B CRISPR module RAMP protein Cmr6 n=1 Tax=Oryzibacter oryziterrae TaxID=2766474 RepID=UPI001F02FB3C|nr:type III-B CRISPR module RAMP protein Cmr6 [Oryzibacter oryziterrae]
MSLFDDLVDMRKDRSSGVLKRNEAPLPAFLSDLAMTESAQPGLWWERYGCDFVELIPEKPNKKTGVPEPAYNTFKLEKKEWTEKLVKIAENSSPAEAVLRAYVDRQKRIAQSMSPNGISFTMELSSRLITGTGIPHPIENGLLFHPTLGCPYIPGSSVKGMVQSFADEWLRGDAYTEVPSELGEVMTRIFGQPERLAGSQAHKSGITALGSVAFLDAIPITRPKIVADVMTPHVGKYLTGGATYPKEDVAPIPLYFPVVEKGCRLRFTLVPTVAAGLKNEEEVSSDILLAGGWLVAGLRDIGIGAKTKSGYGRFIGPC